KEVLAAIAEGHTSQHIADALCVSLLTIETHRRNLLTKFGVNNTALLIRQAGQMGLI
ncbi:MAG: response regulator transcription factor, partial [Sphingobacteriales bacterium]